MVRNEALAIAEQLFNCINIIEDNNDIKDQAIKEALTIALKHVQVLLAGAAPSIPSGITTIFYYGQKVVPLIDIYIPRTSSSPDWEYRSFDVDRKSSPAIRRIDIKNEDLRCRGIQGYLQDVAEVTEILVPPCKQEYRSPPTLLRVKYFGFQIITDARGFLTYVADATNIRIVSELRAAIPRYGQLVRGEFYVWLSQESIISIMNQLKPYVAIESYAAATDYSEPRPEYARIGADMIQSAVTYYGVKIMFNSRAKEDHEIMKELNIQNDGPNYVIPVVSSLPDHRELIIEAPYSTLDLIYEQIAKLVVVLQRHDYVYMRG